jgi:hypothetical protein
MAPPEFRQLFPGKPRANGRRLSYKFAQTIEYTPPRPSAYNPANKIMRETSEVTVEGTFENGRLSRFLIRAYTEPEFQ